MNQGSRILIIEDDADINDIVATFLRKRGFICTQAFSGSEARLVLEWASSHGSQGSVTREAVGDGASKEAKSAETFDLLITDLMLPGLQGKDLVAQFREHYEAPIIVISAQDTPAQKVELLGLGADDYLVKPFDLEELLARVLVQLRHANRTSSSSPIVTGTRSVIRFKEWTLDSQARLLEAKGTNVKLTRLEFNIVESLMNRPTKVFTKQELFEVAWNEECFVEEKAINVHISNIRSKLKKSGTEGYIKTVWGIGFKLIDEHEQIS